MVKKLPSLVRAVLNRRKAAHLEKYISLGQQRGAQVRRANAAFQREGLRLERAAVREAGRIARDAEKRLAAPRGPLHDPRDRRAFPRLPFSFEKGPKGGESALLDSGKRMYKYKPAEGRVWERGDRGGMFYRATSGEKVYQKGVGIYRGHRKKYK